MVIVEHDFDNIFITVNGKNPRKFCSCSSHELSKSLKVQSDNFV